ncbi:sugar transferase [Mycolicibacterium pallens]|uniref:Sugar transferase n=1 Tax=Mycolicibacterium pallens TaxID=370524 RepID=A0ABX8VJ84_9MYCO|nr:sugar transferase [Mycolicibacterium pallens]APE16676.1 polyprenyl glycosylphosphotransferase [Mycobacterium sp. WY10]QYL17867.1 sugar transferase [Mycolicibacterium pallens]
MSIEVPPKRPASAFGRQRTGPLPGRVENDTRVAIDTKKAHRHGLRHRQLLRVSDSVSVAASAAVGAVLIRHISTARAGELGIRDVIVVAVAMAVALQLHGLYRRPDGRLRPSEWWRPAVIARCLPTAALLALAADAFILRGERAMTLTAAVAMTLPAIVFVPFGRRLVVRMFDPTVSRILVIGTGPISDRLTSRLQRCPDTLVVGHVDNNAAPGVPVLGGLDDLPDICAKHAIDRVIIGFPNTSDAIVLDALRRLEGQVPVSEIPRYFELHNWRSEAEELHGLTLMHMPTPSLAASARITKRIMDVTLATCALVVAAPVMALVAVAIKLDSRGPVFFRQERTGRGGKPFRIFKFRSMTADAWERRAAVSSLNQSDGPLFKMASDPRVTRVGALIRKTSLDELPQLINVVRGEMSLVGPRPLPTEEADRLDGAALARLDVSPGITGLWQVCGRSDLSYADLQHLDSAYVRSWSLTWDLRILLQTPQVVFGRNGAY